MSVSYLPDRRCVIRAEMQIESFNFVVTAQTYSRHPTIYRYQSLLLLPFPGFNSGILPSIRYPLPAASVQHWFIPSCFPPTPLYLYSQSHLFEAFSYA
jgi:hypothetical protein